MQYRPFPLLILAAVLAHSDLAGKPPIPLKPEFWEQQPGTKVAVVLTELPLGGRFYQEGSQGLLDIALVGTARSEMVKMVNSLDSEPFASLAEVFVSELQANGYDAVLYEKRVLQDELERRKKTGKNQYKFDLSHIFEETGAQQVVLLDLIGYGVSRSYYGFMAVNKPLGVAYVRGYLISGADHEIWWDTGFRDSMIKEQILDDAWDAPPEYPELRKTIGRTLGKAEKFLAERFFEDRLSNAAYEHINDQVVNSYMVSRGDAGEDSMEEDVEEEAALPVGNMSAAEEEPEEPDDETRAAVDSEDGGDETDAAFAQVASKEEETETEENTGADKAGFWKYLVDIESSSGMTTGCRKPYRMTQDCNNWNYAGRKILINGTEARINGSENGDVVMVMAFHFTKKYADFEALQGFEKVVGLFEANGLSILNVRGMRFNKNYIGYWIELDGDGYSLLKPYTQE